MIERESFNGTPCGRSEPSGKARMMEGGREGGMDGWGEEGGGQGAGGGSHTEGPALLRMNYSRVFLLMLVKDERKV